MYLSQYSPFDDEDSYVPQPVAIEPFISPVPPPYVPPPPEPYVETKFSVLRADLYRAMQPVLRITKNNNRSNCLGNCIMHSDVEDHLIVEATDFETSMRLGIHGIGTLAKTVLSPEDLLALIGKPKKTDAVLVSLTREEYNVSIRDSEGSTGRIPVTFCNEDYPIIPGSPEPSSSIEISSQDFLDGIAFTEYAISEDHSRPNLNGVFIQTAATPANEMTFTATDGHRLATIKKPFGGDFMAFANADGIIMHRTGLSVLKSLCERYDYITLSRIEGGLLALAGETVVHIRPIEETYPEISRVIPKEFPSCLTFPKERLADALAKVKSFVTKNYYATGIRIGDGLFDVMVDNPEKGTRQASFAVAEVEVGLCANYNWNFLSDVLKSFDGDVKIEWIDDISAMRLSCNENGFCIIMPVRK